MIPEFPIFKPLELADREDVMRYTSVFVPYSDFNFISMWSWDTDYEFQISVLNDNLVVRFMDYISGDPFLSFIGKDKIEDTTRTLLEYADKMQLQQSLRLIPEVDSSQLEKSFSVQEDRDSFDYLLTVEHMNGFKGNRLRGKRNFLKRCERIYSPEVRILSIWDEQIKKEILSVVKEWMEERMGEGDIPNAKEFAAISKLLNSGAIPNVISIGVYIEGEMKGFVIGEILEGGYAMLHFEKASSVDLVGIYSYLMYSFALELSHRGCKYINHEQDLGDEGLRKHKESLLPTMLKKYIITKQK